jgi:hypothetical protein
MTFPQCEKCGKQMRSTGFLRPVSLPLYQCDVCHATMAVADPCPLPPADRRATPYGVRTDDQTTITWIPFEDGLPGFDKPVLLGNCLTERTAYGWRTKLTGGWSLGADFRPLWEFTHWCELPAPPLPASEG